MKNIITTNGEFLKAMSVDKYLALVDLLEQAVMSLEAFGSEDVEYYRDAIQAIKDNDEYYTGRA